MPGDSKISLLIRMAELYYERGLSQREISELLSLSRPMVSRLLSEARERGIVTVTIHRPVEKRADLSRALLDRFELREAVVVPGSDPETAQKNVGAAAAELLGSVVQNGFVVGVSWGRDLCQAVEALPRYHHGELQVVQLAGGLGEGDVTSDGPELARRLGEKLGGRVRYLHAPTAVQTSEMRRLLIEQPQIAQTIALSGRLDIALTGIGSLDDASSSLGRAGYLSQEERRAFRRRGGVAHLLGYLLDGEGNPLEHGFNQRIIAAPLDHLHRATWSLGIASAPIKSGAVLAALNGGHFNTVVLSEAVAQGVLDATTDVAA